MASYAATSDDDHIRDLIEQVLFTSPGERVMRPDFGAGLLALVFEPNSVELRVWCGALWPNLARAALVILCRLGFLAALGIAAKDDRGRIYLANGVRVLVVIENYSGNISLQS